MTREKRALYLSKQDANAGAWLTCSLVDKANRMKDSEWHTAFTFRFNQPVHQFFRKNRHASLMCDCKPPRGNDGPPPCLDARGVHALICKKGGKVQSRHNWVDNTLERMSNAAGILTTSEPRFNQLLNPANGKRLIGDHRTISGEQVMDTTITNPLCPSMLAKSAVESGYAAQLAVKAKRVKYKDQIDLGIKLQVIAIETPGKMAEETVLYVKRLASKIAARVDMDYAVVKRRWMEKISVMLQRGNAHIIAHRMDKAIQRKYGYKNNGEYTDLYRLTEQK